MGKSSASFIDSLSLVGGHKKAMGSECGVLVKQANNSIDHMKAASIF